nr:MAG TPA: PROTEIN/RNA Complex translation initiation, 48S, small [Caudoviricetes sp.]
MKTNILSYTASKNYVENGTTYRIDVKIQLTDECKNGVYHWSITADIYGKRQNGRFVWCSGGCCHNEISKHFPEFSKFVALHLSDCYGAPLYAVENGYYHMKNSSKETVIDYLRITETEYNLLCQSEDKQYFKYLLYSMGIVNRWNEESKAAIKDLEALTGNEWVNPYEYDKERKHIEAFTDEEAAEFNERIESSYYTPEAIQARKKAESRRAYEVKRAEIISDYEKKVSRLEEEKTVKLYILDSGLSIDNVIYYADRKEVVFNWLEYRDKIGQEIFIDFLNNVDYSKLPEGITFKMK